MFGSWGARTPQFAVSAWPQTICGSYDGCNVFQSCGTAGSGYELFTSTDGGKTFISSLLSDQVIKACGSNSDRRIYLSSIGGSESLHLSLDGGLTTSTLFEAYTSNAFNQDLAVSHSLSTIYLVQSNTLYKTSSMGVSWVSIESLGYFSTVNSVACSSNGQYVGLIGNPGFDDSGFGNTIYSSSDFGSTWVTLSSSNPGKPLHLTTRQDLQTISISGDGSTIFAGAYQEQLNTSRDFGSTFTTVSFRDAIPGLYYYRSSAINSNGSIILAGAYNTAQERSYVVQTLNGGSTWSVAIPYNDEWRNVYVSQNGLTRCAANGYIFTFGSLASNFSTFDLATSLIELQPTWSYQMVLPDPAEYSGKQITFVKNSPHLIQFLSPQSTVVHTLSNTFAQFTAASSNWLVLGNDSGFYSNSYYVNNLFTTNYTNDQYTYKGAIQNPQVITDLAVFPGFLSGYEISSIIFLQNSNSVQASTLEASSFFFQTSLTLPLTISSQALLYNGTNYSQSIAGEIMQTLTA